MANKQDSSSPSAASRPELPKEVDWKGVAVGKAKAEMESASKSTDPVAGQKHVAAIDEILKNIASLQTEVGALRRQASNFIAKLRVESPKGRPAEGSVREIEGRKYVFEKGRYWPVDDSAAS